MLKLRNPFNVTELDISVLKNEPRRKKIGLQDFQPNPTNIAVQSKKKKTG